MDLDAAAGRSPLDGPLTGLRPYASVRDDDERAWIRAAQAGSVDALERLCIKLEQWENLKDVYGKKAELTQSVDEKKRIFAVLGQVYDDRLNLIADSADLPALSGSLG